MRGGGIMDFYARKAQFPPPWKIITLPGFLYQEFGQFDVKTISVSDPYHFDLDPDPDPHPR